MGVLGMESRPVPEGFAEALGPRGGLHGGAQARRILELLHGGMSEPKDGPAARGATTLEYHGQWQPRPNGAETGHGVVPQDWAIELASENDRRLASFAWAGGAQNCLSNAFRQADEMEAQAQDLLDSGLSAEDGASVLCIRAVATAAEEREALMRRQWCDIDFQEGEEANKELLQHLEQDFASQLVRVAARQVRQEKERESALISESKAGGQGATPLGPWYNIKVVGSAKPGKVYLSGRLDGAGLELHGYDDESGRQRWIIEAGENVAAAQEATWYRLRLRGGVSRGRRLLSRGAAGVLELCERDDASGRQRWHLLQCGGRQVTVRPAAGNPGVGAAAAVEAAVLGTCLSATAEGGIVLRRVDISEVSSHEQWAIPGWPGLQQLSAEDSSRSIAAAPHRGDDVVALMARGSSETSSFLGNLSEEQMARVLNQNRNLGTSIDLVGAYLKNYEIDKADRLCARIEPLCRERGGLWLFKLLNFYTTVRMKQSRYEQALRMYQEYETLIGYSPDEAWELYDTVYRNFGWIYTSLHDYERALEYFEKAVEIKRASGVKAHWFDQWDLGKTHARLSLQHGQPENLELALRLIKEALEIHRQSEPQDIIMRCKMLNSAGECAAIRGDFCPLPAAAAFWHEEAVRLHEESLDQYMRVLGPSKPLTGWAMEDLAGAYRRRGRLEEAKQLLHGALKVECSKDIIKLSSMARLLDSILELHRRTQDREGLVHCQEAVDVGLRNLQRRRVDQTEAASFAALLEKLASALLEHDEARNAAAAAALLEAGLGYLRQVEEGLPAAVGSDDEDDDGETGRRTARRAGAEAAEERPCLGLPRAGPAAAGQQGLAEVDAAALRLRLEARASALRAAAASSAAAGGGGGSRAADAHEQWCVPDAERGGQAPVQSLLSSDASASPRLDVRDGRCPSVAQPFSVRPPPAFSSSDDPDEEFQLVD